MVLKCVCFRSQCQFDVGMVNSHNSLMLYELSRTLEHNVAFTVQLILGTFCGAPLPLRSIYGGGGRSLAFPHHYTPDRANTWSVDLYRRMLFPTPNRSNEGNKMKVVVIL